MKLTEWFPGDVKPVRVGVYERSWENGEKFDYPYYFWDGKQWRGQGVSREDEMIRNTVSVFQNNPWRGLAKEPK